VKIFFPVLNWGLGHASRSLPMIRHYKAQGHEVLVASDGEALSMLRTELPDTMVLQLPGYGIQYGSRFMPVNMLKHGPTMLRTMKQEHELTAAIIKRHEIDCIISDNRYGCYSADIPSAIITHQLQVFTGQKILDVYIRRQIRNWVRKFSEIWIPDQEPPGNITGDLTGLDMAPVPKYYLGTISELQCHPREGRYDAVAILSGPEPQRTHFEQILTKQLSAMDGNFAIVRGKPDINNTVREEGNLVIYSFLSRAGISKLLNETELVIARSGYTTLMDLARTGHRAILCPTPGQYEQIYLADRLHNSNQCVYMRQDSIDLKSAFEKIPLTHAIGYAGREPDKDFSERLYHLCGKRMPRQSTSLAS
jgi:UDP:flavonoid glycosyltransferase YjiC (YdhE family)